MLFQVLLIISIFLHPISCQLLGGDRDSNGCIRSAGYRWCDAEKSCIRPWELASNSLCINELKCLATGCDAGYECDETTRTCVAVSCDAANACQTSEVCIPDTNIQCIKAPCPQFRCQKSLCSRVRCKDGYECDPLNGKCVAVSCQAKDACAAGEMCTPSRKVCIRAPCQQFTCSGPCGGACPNGTQCNTRTNTCDAVTCDYADACNEDQICTPKKVTCRQGIICPQFTCENRCQAPFVWKSCGTRCPASCSNPNPICVAVCSSGCFCPDDQVLSPEGKCVKQSECGCLATGCSTGSECDKLTRKCVTVTCENPNACAKSDICIPREAQCIRAPCPQFTCEKSKCKKNACKKKGYECDPLTGDCVAVSCDAKDACKNGFDCVETPQVCAGPSPCPQFECREQCKDGKEFRPCGTACPPTCENPRPQICTKQCVVGCFCPLDKVLDKNGKCVDVSQCAPVKNSCDSVVCNPGYACDSLTGACVAVSCAAYDACPSDQTCVDRSDIRCIRAPCPQFECQSVVTENKCLTVKCSAVTQCNPKTGACEPIPTGPQCANPLPDLFCGRGGQACPSGSTCEIDPLDRFAVCCPDATCDSTSCADGFECDSISGQCVAVSCAAPDACGADLICVDQQITCIRAPCPQFQCRERCTESSCGENYACDTAVGVCVPVTCDAPDACPSGYQCNPSEFICKKAPCPQFQCNFMCPMPPCARPPAGCNWVFPEPDANGCFASCGSLQCPDCTPEECGPQPLAPVQQCSDGSFGGPTGKCFRNLFDEGCSWEIRTCPAASLCDSVVCENGFQCDESTGQCVVVCPQILCAPTPPGCKWVFQGPDERGCVTSCGNLECAECTPEDCGPQRLAPIKQCADGSLGGPTGQCVRRPNEGCFWEVRTCPEDSCDFPKVWSDCGSSCAPTCDNPAPEICTMMCVAKCFCPPELVEDANGNCIPLDQCPVVTENKCLTVKCTALTECNPKTGACEPKKCSTADCGPPLGLKTILCDDGSVGGNTGSCILNADGNCGWEIRACPVTDLCAAVLCPFDQTCDPLTGMCQKACSAPKQWNSCGSSCPRTCDNPDPRACNKMCVADCFCPSELVLDANGRCIRLEECPVKDLCATVRCSAGYLCNSATGQCDPLQDESSCPRFNTDAVGTCVEECSSLYQCQRGQICCFNGCGHSCVDPVRQCKPKCKNKTCGSDGCGGICGKCARGRRCSTLGRCVKN